MAGNDMEVDKLTDEEALIILFLFLFQKSSEHVSELWLNFENEIKYNNRFFSENEILNELDELKTQAEMVLSTGEIFYRARLIDSIFPGMTQKNEKEILDMIVRHYPEMKGKDARQVYLFLCNIGDLLKLENPLMQEVTDFLHQRKRFWGYDKKGSDAPPQDVTSSGRANPRFISYLYLADSKKTAILEVRPHLGQNVSVAKFRIDRDLKIYDFSNTNNRVGQTDLFTLSMISEAFSDYKTGREEDYYATQYICEYIKHLGYDGIRFKSSINPKGKNTVLFDTSLNKETKKKNYTILNSKIYYVSNIDIQCSQIAPFEPAVKL